MTRHNESQLDRMDRRGFLKALAASTTAATVLGGGAALLVDRAKKAPVKTTVLASPALPPVRAAIEATPAGTDTSDLLARLASAQADNLRLQTELDAALRRVETLEGSSGNISEENQALRTQLASANTRVSLLAGLVALYEQLEGLDLAATVNGGLDAFGNAIESLVGELPGLEAGIAAGQAALEDLEAHLPTLQSGRVWLEGQLGRLNTFYDATERVLEAAVETAGSFLQKLNEWFQSVLKWLPFGSGEKAAAVMNALTNLVNETPATVHGLRRNVADPLDTWLQEEGGETRLQKRLVNPIKEQALRPASTVAERARTAKERYEQELVAPARTAAKSRNLIREQIAAYRKKYEI